MEFGISDIQCYTKEEEKEREEKKVTKIIYKKIGTKLIANTKKLKLKI